jgi:recombination protein RecT
MVKQNIVQLTAQNRLATFETKLSEYESAIVNLLGRKYGISPEEFMVKAANAIKKQPKLLKCNTQSLFGSILFFAELGLSFNTPEGFGYIIAEETKPDYFEATPRIGYQGLIEIAYRNPKVKSIKFQSVYKNDAFDYAYGTDEYLTHKPTMHGDRGYLTHAYAVAKLDGLETIFAVVHKAELDKIQKLSKTSSNESFHNSEADVFNIMYAKTTIKLLCKMLPKTNNEALLKVLDIDNKLDFKKNTKIEATETGYVVIEEKPKPTAMEKQEPGTFDIEISSTPALKEKQKPES